MEGYNIRHLTEKDLKTLQDFSGKYMKPDEIVIFHWIVQHNLSYAIIDSDTKKWIGYMIIYPIPCDEQVLYDLSSLVKKYPTVKTAQRFKSLFLHDIRVTKEKYYNVIWRKLEFLYYSIGYTRIYMYNALANDTNTYKIWTGELGFTENDATYIYKTICRN